MKVRWFWQRQADERKRRAQIKDLLNSLPPRSLAANDSAEPTDEKLSAAADAVAAHWNPERSVHESLMGNPNSDFIRKIRWLDMLRQAKATGADRMMVLDPKTPGCVHVDVELSLFAAELDVLDALAPGLRRPELVDQVREHLHAQALQAMADKDAQ